MKQNRFPTNQVFHAGDTVRVTLHPGAQQGKGFVRTNLGGAMISRREVIRHITSGIQPEGTAWHDVEMNAAGNGFSLELPLLEVGVFEAKCFLRTPQGEILWADGENFRFKVEPAENVAVNTLYCAFVRQFGGNAAVSAEKRQDLERRAAELDQAGYTVIPPSGTFRQLIGKLDHIFDGLGCRILQLLPVHPVPTVYGRMGRYGSPFAALDYFAVDPALADFDPKATPMEQFLELVDAVHARRGRLFLDIPVNHTGWASRLQNEHPEYFVREGDRTFVSPGAWGVVWADLCKLNFNDPPVTELLADVFLHWCRKGVDGFRCDAGYMLPRSAWDYIVARVRLEYPDTVFLLEGLGGPIPVQEKLLGEAGLDWAYSELFQNYDRRAITDCENYARYCSERFGTLIHFAETHDNLRLAATSTRYSAMRCALAALFSHNGAFGFANGVEFFATERIDVHGAGSLNWGAVPNQVSLLRRLSEILAEHPAFWSGARREFLDTGNGCLAMLRSAASGEEVLVLINPDCDHDAQLPSFGERLPGAYDLISRRSVDPRYLPAGGFYCLAAKPLAVRMPLGLGEPRRVTEQRALLAVRRAAVFFHAPLPESAEGFLEDPWAECCRLCNSQLPPVTVFRIGRDERRIVPVTAGEILLVECDVPFRAELTLGMQTLRCAKSLPRKDGGEFALLMPGREPQSRHDLVLKIEVYPPGGKPERRHAPLLLLPPPERALFRMDGDGESAPDLLAFASNDRGGMTMVRAAWGMLQSKYEALLAANGDAPCPVNRRVMFTRCRGWLVADGFSHEIDSRTLQKFVQGTENCAQWHFRIPSGQQRMTDLFLRLEGGLDGDAVRLIFRRREPHPDAVPEVRIILRPDLEDRDNHEVTKAYLGAEKRFPAAVSAAQDGFTFAPDPARRLRLTLPGGKYVSEPEWQYMVHLELEERYGLEHKTDLFSPGYFEFTLRPGESRTLTAGVNGAEDSVRWPEPDQKLPEHLSPMSAAKANLKHFVVRRDQFKTVIAGYPWFLDWGRDTLIALRGLIAAGIREDAAAILRQFASFEEKGTIPNIIHGSEVGNRDTSDAPLWLFVAARDYLERFHDRSLLDSDCGGRSFREVLGSIIRHYRQGTPNGIRMDRESGLIFSPPHFTWMDTNFPAGTPREGYPIEIQALWYAALSFCGEKDLAAQVSQSIEKRFYLPDLGRFSDCLHGSAMEPDDHVRCNQLFALTLGAVQSPEYAGAIVRSAAELLVPGAIRSLSDRTVRYELPVVHHGQLLNDPRHPYIGIYQGAEDTCRKASYHNGTAWNWPFPSYCEALYLAGGEAVRKRALSLLYSAAVPADQWIPGMMPEIMDGNAPHRSQGCAAQAWSMTEFYRVARLLAGED
ncbi:MAG: glycogen debranching enzyme N-terminal domain-containing protein [Lentisphaeria bacterium]|nr:glycogen debranching enzyme N-terminal domain-containing protein [Lentisphaeria bacterium]